jgi:predicted hydrocarbon binding protein
MWDFKVGQRVVCVDDKDQPQYFSSFLVEGNIYIIRKIDFCHTSNRLGVYVEGITGILTKMGKEIGFKASRFRPLTDRDANVSSFLTNLLNSVKEKTYNKDLDLEKNPYIVEKQPELV